MKRLLKQALSNEVLLRYSKGNRFIFCYHDISDPTAPHHSARYSTTPERFKEHVELFMRLFTVVPLDVLVSEERLPSGKNYAAITFDDGFHSVLTQAWPVLREARLPCTVFLNGASVLHGRGWITDLVLAAHDPAFVSGMLAATGLGQADATDPIGAIMARGRFTSAFAHRPVLAPTTKTYLDVDDVRQLHGEGVFFVDHGWEHCVLSRCDEAMLEAEVTLGKEMITGITGQVPRHFALPFGKREHFDNWALAALRRHGYTHVYTTNPNRVRPHRLGGISVLPRISVMDERVGQLLFNINRSVLRNYAI